MTKITKYFEEAAGKTLFSIEIIPPMKGQHLGELMSHIEPLMEFKPPFIEVTYHREEYVEKVVDGVTKRIPIRKRPGTLGICASIMQRFQIEAVPHVICGGFTKEETEDFLIDLHYLGLEPRFFRVSERIVSILQFNAKTVLCESADDGLHDMTHLHSFVV